MIFLTKSRIIEFEKRPKAKELYYIEKYGTSNKKIAIKLSLIVIVIRGKFIYLYFWKDGVILFI